MNENNNLSVLPWYDNIDEQNSRKSYAYGNIYPLFTPAHSLLPFQILRKPNEVFNPNVKLYTKDGVFVLDITEQMVLTGLQLAKPENTDKMEVIVYPAYFPLQEKIPIGMYYAVLNDGVNTWYSDIFTIINDSENYLSIEWYDDDTLYCDAGIIVYRNPTFRNRVYFCTEIGKPDYTFEEKKVIFSRFALPKVLKRIGLLENECIITDDGLDQVIMQFSDTTGVRDLEQAAEHIAANALYQIEVDHKKQVTFDAQAVKELFA